MDPNSIDPNTGSYLASLWYSDVVWAAVIAAFLTITGVIITNIFNRRNIKQQIEHTTKENNKEREIQKLQLRHASNENDQERKMQLKKSLLIEAVETISTAIHEIGNLFVTLTYSDKIEICPGMLLAIAKIHMVGTLDTIKSSNKFNEEFEQKSSSLINISKKYKFLQKERESYWLQILIIGQKPWSKMLTKCKN